MVNNITTWYKLFQFCELEMLYERQRSLAIQSESIWMDLFSKCVLC